MRNQNEIVYHRNSAWKVTAVSIQQGMIKVVCSANCKDAFLVPGFINTWYIMMDWGKQDGVFYENSHFCFIFRLTLEAFEIQRNLAPRHPPIRQCLPAYKAFKWNFLKIFCSDFHIGSQAPKGINEMRSSGVQLYLNTLLQTLSSDCVLLNRLNYQNISAMSSQ